MHARCFTVSRMSTEVTHTQQLDCTSMFKRVTLCADIKLDKFILHFPFHISYIPDDADPSLRTEKRLLYVGVREWESPLMCLRQEAVLEKLKKI